MPKIFITGVTGYIAGDAFYALQQTHPDYDYTVLVRTQEKADKITAEYPKVRIVLGNLDDAEILERESKHAEIVLHAADASDHEGAAKSISKGLLSGHDEKRPGYWLHTGGTGILTYFDSAAEKYGEYSEKQFNDWSGVTELTTLPDEAFHRNVDKIVLGTDPEGTRGVRTAIVCPPTIYGRGRGPVAQRGRQVYELAKLILQKGYAPVIGKGKARWNNVHITDLSDVFVKLVEAAVDGRTSASQDQLWGSSGYYFTENGEHEWGALSTQLGSKAGELKLVNKTPEQEVIGKDEAVKVAGFEALSWGLNSRGKAERARRVLGWTPKGKSLEAEIPDILQEEHARL